MKQCKMYVVFLLFALSLAALWWIASGGTPWQGRDGARDASGGRLVSLGDIPVSNYDRMGFTKAIVRYIPKEKGWLVGTERGELFLFSDQGEQRWKRSLGIGKLVSAALSPAGDTAYVGEQSPTGTLYAVNVHTGDIRWQYAASDFVGSDPSQRSYPSVVHIAVDGKGTVYANCYRFLMQKDGGRAYAGRMIAVRRDGSLAWQYPRAEVIDSWINWCDVNDANGRVVLSTSAYDFREEMRYKDTLYFLRRDDGQELRSVAVAPVEPFENTVLRGSPNFSADGRYLAASCSDGRGFLFDGRGNILWERTLSAPTRVAGAWINASGRDGFALAEGVVFTTINTFNRENWQLPTPVEHPSNNSLFLFHYDGSFGYQYRARGTMEELAFGEGIVACAVGRNVRTHDYSCHGALVLRLRDGRKLDFYPTEGPLQAIAVSPDGRHLAGVEAPVLTPEGRTIGAYRLHIWRRESAGPGAPV